MLPPAIGAHLPLLVGLLLGTLAKYGLALDLGEPIEGRRVLGHCMMLGMLGLIADLGCGALAANGAGRTLSGASAALVAGPIIDAWRRRGADAARRKGD